MTTPVLSKKQQRNSLSAKKTPVKGLRNVLLQPHENYWPIVDSKAGTVLEGVMAQLIKVIRRPTAKLPWSQLRHIKKEERALEREETLSQQMNMPNKILLKSVITGINAVTRALEKKSICCVLLDSNVEPSLLIKHVVMMAQNKQVPILLVPFLKSVTATSIGYASASFALKNVVAEMADHYFHLLYTTILNAVENAPQPKKTLHLSNDTQSQETPLKKKMEVPKEISVKKEVEVPKETPLKKEIEVPKEIPPEPAILWSNRPSVSGDPYKYRTSSRKRVFVPANAENEIEIIETKSSDYISISHYEVPDSDEEDHIVPTKRSRISDDSCAKPEVQYLSLKVKRQQGNLGRAKATKIPSKKKK